MSYTNPILLQFLKEHPERKDADWAELFGCSRTHFLGIRSGKSDPSKALIERIAEQTGGQVPILSWFTKPETKTPTE